MPDKSFPLIPFKTANGDSLKSKYVSVYILSAVICSNCQKSVMPEGLIYRTTQAALQQVADEVHDKGISREHIICANRKLMIIYGQAFVLRELVEK